LADAGLDDPPGRVAPDATCGASPAAARAAVAWAVVLAIALGASFNKARTGLLATPMLVCCPAVCARAAAEPGPLADAEPSRLRTAELGPFGLVGAGTLAVATAARVGTIV